jgi:hypothetical protein
MEPGGYQKPFPRYPHTGIWLQQDRMTNMGHRRIQEIEYAAAEIESNRGAVTRGHSGSVVQKTEGKLVFA